MVSYEIAEICRASLNGTGILNLASRLVLYFVFRLEINIVLKLLVPLKGN